MGKIRLCLFSSVIFCLTPLNSKLHIVNLYFCLKTDWPLHKQKNVGWELVGYLPYRIFKIVLNVSADTMSKDQTCSYVQILADHNFLKSS